MIEASPNLSDEVLLETITRNPSLNAWHMAEIMMANAPVNPLVWEAFVAQTTLPDFLFNYVVYYQENGGTTQKKELEMAIKTQVDIKEKASSDYVRGQMLLEDNADKNQKILDLYEVDEDNRAIRRKIAALSSAGQHDDAETLLEAYSQNSTFDAYPQVQGIITTMNATGNEPSNAEKSLLYSIAEGNKFGKYKAQALLNYLDGAEFEYPIVLPDLGQKSIKDVNDRGKNALPLMVVHPNPTNGLVYFTYQLPVEMEVAHIYLFNVEGKRVASLDITNGYGISPWNVSHLPKGAYIATLEVDGKQVSDQKLIVQ